MENIVVSLPRSEIAVEWGMWFYCAVAHPALMIRREVVFGGSDVGGHGERYGRSRQTNAAEDYALWMRLLASEKGPPVQFANLGHVLLRLRKHEASASRKNREQQAEDGMRAVSEAMSQRLGMEVNLRMVQCLQRPEMSTTLSELQASADLLLKLEQSYLVVDGQSPGNEETNEKGKARSSDCRADHTQDECDFIMEDTTARIRAMSVIGLQRFGGDAAPLLQLAQSRGGGVRSSMAMFGV